MVLPVMKEELNIVIMATGMPSALTMTTFMDRHHIICAINWAISLIVVSYDINDIMLKLDIHYVFQKLFCF